MNTTTMQNRKGYTLISRVSWSAILAGVVIGLTLESLLNLLGLGLGFTALSADSDALAKIGMGSFIWLITSGIIAMLVGGWAAGWFSNTSCRFNGALHGFITWGLATLLMIVMMASAAGVLISGTTNLIGQGLSLASQGAISTAQGVTQLPSQVKEAAAPLLPNAKPKINHIMQQANQLIEHLANNSAQNTQEREQSSTQRKQELEQAVIALFNADSENDKADARKKLIEFLSQNADMSSAQAEQKVNDWEQSYEQAKAQLKQQAAKAKEQAKAASEKAAEVASSIALTTFFILLLSAIAASLGGFIGTKAEATKAATLPGQA